MAEYSERTGQVKWQRVVLASQREQIEKWLGEHYPVQPQPQAAPVRSTAAKTERAAVRSAPAAGRRSSSRG